MPLESQVRLAGKVIRIGIDSQHVHVQVLDGFVVPGTIEVTRDIDPCVLRRHKASTLQENYKEQRFRTRGRNQKSLLLVIFLEGGSLMSSLGLGRQAHRSPLLL